MSAATLLRPWPAGVPCDDASAGASPSPPAVGALAVADAAGIAMPAAEDDGGLEGGVAAQERAAFSPGPWPKTKAAPARVGRVHAWPVAEDKGSLEGEMATQSSSTVSTLQGMNSSSLAESSESARALLDVLERAGDSDMAAGNNEHA